MMKTLRISLLMMAVALGLWAQTPPCVVNFNFTAQGQTTTQTNCLANTQGVVNWRLVYVVNGFNPVSLQVESAPDNNGVPGAWVAFSGTVIEGPNPATNVVQGTIRLSGYNRWVRVNAVTLTGAGNVAGVIYGCTEPGCSLVGAAGASPVTVTNTPLPVSISTNPVPVAGTAADGAAAAGNPVQVGGVDQLGNARHLSVNPNGDQAFGTQSAAADGQANQWAFVVTGQGGTQAPLAVMPLLFNPAGPTWDRTPGTVGGGAFVQGPVALGSSVATSQPIFIAGRSSGSTGGNIAPIGTCDSNAAFTITAGSSAVIVPGVAGRRTRICALAWSNSTAVAASIQFKSGTGTTCGTGTNNLTGVMVTTLQGVPFGIGSGLGFIMNTVAAADDFCATAVASNYTGWVAYAIF